VSDGRTDGQAVASHQLYAVVAYSAVSIHAMLSHAKNRKDHCDLSLSESRVWPFKVTWRHRSRDSLVARSYWKSI